MHVGCTKTATLTNEQRKEHLKTEHVYHTTLLLQHGIKLGKELETLLTRDPRLLSRHPHVFKNYDGVIADIMGQLQQNSTEFNILRSTVQEQSQRITSLERKITNLDSSSISSTSHNNSIQGVMPNVCTVQRITNAENKLGDHELLLVESNRTLETCFRDVGNARRLVESNQEIVRRVERRIESIEHTLALRNVTLADLEDYVRQQEFSTHDGQMIWKISEFARRRNEAVSGQQVSFYSPAFPTSKYGYKMCARIYLNGDGMGRGTHISVFFVVMRSQYDAILRWPFRQKVTFMLMDQDNVEHVIDAFRPDPSSSSFQRPRRETNIASGCPMFCSLTELNNHAYVRDDAMFIKIIVDTSDL